MLKLILTDYTLQIVALGSALLGIISGVLGSFSVIRKQSLLGDAVSHAALPGIAVVFILTQTKQTEFLLLGALISGLLANFIIHVIEEYSRIKFDSALALILSVFFGGGLVLLTYIQKIPNANQAGIDSFIFGQASTLLKRDIYLMLGVGVIILTIVMMFWKEFKIISFDPDFAMSLGFPTNKISFLLSGLTVAAIIIGLQTVGVILMSALLICPAVAARQWTNKLHVMVILSSCFGVISGVLGTLISSSISKVPTGPTIGVIVSLIVFISLIFAPQRGMLWTFMKRQKNKKEINEDKVLMDLYHLSINHQDKYHSHEVATIHANAYMKDKKSILAVLQKLVEKGLVAKDYFQTFALTDAGIAYVENYFGKEERNDDTSN